MPAKAGIQYAVCVRYAYGGGYRIARFEAGDDSIVVST